VLFAFVPALMARTGTLRTFDGNTFTGQLRITTAGVTVVNAAEGLVLRISGTNIAAISFPFDPPAFTEENTFGALPSEWRETDIGNVRMTGSTRYDRKAFTVRGGGLGIEGEVDSFHFVYQPAHGDGEIVARVNSIQYTHPNAKAGLMMRETMSEYARNVMIAATASRGGSFQSRYFENRATQMTPQPDIRAPYYLKLRRRGSDFSAFKSPNGRQWTLVEQTHVPMGENYYVGLAVANARENGVNWTTFDKVRTGVRLPAIAEEDFMPRVELTSGSIVLGRPLHADRNEIDFVGGLRVVRVPTDRVARIIYQPLTSELAWKTRASRPGVWVQSGDFFDGEFQQIASDTLRMSSVLYGLRTFDVSDEVVAVVLDHARLTRPVVELSATDGSLLLGSGYSFEDGAVVVKESSLGPVRIPIFAIADLRVR